MVLVFLWAYTIRIIYRQNHPTMSNHRESQVSSHGCIVYEAYIRPVYSYYPVGLTVLTYIRTVPKPASTLLYQEHNL